MYTIFCLREGHCQLHGNGLSTVDNGLEVEMYCIKVAFHRNCTLIEVRIYCQIIYS